MILGPNPAAEEQGVISDGANLRHYKTFQLEFKMKKEPSNIPPLPNRRRLTPISKSKIKYT
jgi:hypothetical protein